MNKAICFVDVETTGMSYERDRIVEIGLVKLYNDNSIETYSTLIDPDIYIPTDVLYCGITKDELKKAPTFRSVADTILSYLYDSYFVAHNAQFDYGFIKKQFTHVGEDFTTKVFDTIALSKALDPSAPSHSLDSVAERFELTIKNRHRALDDAYALYEFYMKACNMRGKEDIEKLLFSFHDSYKKPHSISTKLIADLPKSCGIYTFFDKSATPIYIGKANNIQLRVKSHFQESVRSNKELKLFTETVNIQYTKTASELGALLMESETIKKFKPIYNRRLRNSKCFIVTEARINSDGYYQIFSEYTLPKNDSLFVINKNKKQAKDFALNICKSFALCKKLIGIEAFDGKSCFDYKLGNCFGACIGLENCYDYNQRFLEGFSTYAIKKWPYKGQILIQIQDKQGIYKDIFLIDNWCVLKSSFHIPVESDMFMDNYVQDTFTYDTYLILAKYILNSKNKRNITVV